VDIRPNSWRKAPVKRGTFAKNVEVNKCKNFSQVFLLGKAVREAILVQQERVPLERAAFDRKDIL